MICRHEALQLRAGIIDSVAWEHYQLKDSVTALLEDKRMVDNLARAYKKRVADSVVHLAAENRIELDDKEKATLGIE